MPTTNTINARIEAHPTWPGIVRLTWDGMSGIVSTQGTRRQYADFDPCPYRNLTAEESARTWARDVLGVEV